FFIHEMTHVWQAQKRGRYFLPLMRHPFCRYDYELKPGKPFSRYGLEQQAVITADYFLHRHEASNGHQTEALGAMFPFKGSPAAKA
ncbi:MAG: vgr related protein, partial [Sphingomicrobium sp.]